MNIRLNRQEFIEEYSLERGTIILEPFDDFKYAIIGITFNREHIIYDYNKLIEVVSVKNNINTDEAAEYVDYNIINMGFSSHEPIICFTGEY